MWNRLENQYNNYDIFYIILSQNWLTNISKQKWLIRLLILGQTQGGANAPLICQRGMARGQSVDLLLLKLMFRISIYIKLTLSNNSPNLSIAMHDISTSADIYCVISFLFSHTTLFYNLALSYHHFKSMIYSEIVLILIYFKAGNWDWFWSWLRRKTAQKTLV